jgi:hypothetical protein
MGCWVGSMCGGLGDGGSSVVVFVLCRVFVFHEVPFHFRSTLNIFIQNRERETARQRYNRSSVDDRSPHRRISHTRTEDLQ